MYLLVSIYFGVNLSFAVFATYKIYEEQYKIRELVQFKPSELFHNGYCSNARQWRMPVIFINLFLFAVNRLLLFFSLLTTIGVFFLVPFRWYLQYFQIKRYEANAILSLLYSFVDEILNKAFLYLIVANYFGAWDVKGTNDPEAFIKVGLHKSFIDGFTMETLSPISFSFMVDSNIKVVPFIYDLLYNNDSVVIDRKDAVSRKMGVYTAIQRKYDKLKNEKARDLYIFPEGFIMTPDYVLSFKSGAFVALDYVQPFTLLHSRDSFTGIDISTVRSKVVDFLLCLARTYNYIEMEFLPKLAPHQNCNFFDWTLSYEETILKCEQNKDLLKQYSCEYALEYTHYLSEKYNQNIISERFFYDNEDCINWFNYLSINYHQVMAELKDKRGIEYDNTLKKIYIQYVDNVRVSYIEQEGIQDKPELFRSNENLKSLVSFVKLSPNEDDNINHANHYSSYSDQYSINDTKRPLIRNQIDLININPKDGSYKETEIEHGHGHGNKIEQEYEREFDPNNQTKENDITTSLLIENMSKNNEISISN